MNETRNIKGVNIVADLFPLVAEHTILPAFQVAFHEVAQESVQFDARVIRPRQASSRKQQVFIPK